MEKSEILQEKKGKKSNLFGAQEMCTEFQVYGGLCYNNDMWCTSCCAPCGKWQYRRLYESGL